MLHLTDASDFDGSVGTKVSLGEKCNSWKPTVVSASEKKDAAHRYLVYSDWLVLSWNVLCYATIIQQLTFTIISPRIKEIFKIGQP